jgi:GT2 family glycosyltransferase
MLLSVIIVNYNVKYFLEQCLYSVEKAQWNLNVAAQLASEEGSASAGSARMPVETEVFVVDNNSSDGSVEFLKSRFPRVEFIVSGENLGFSGGNNQALAKARGKYILFLNPDTILAEDSLSAGFFFLEANPGVGAAGLRMVDGGGRYLKESQRGFPSPWASFCKLSGLTALFPRSPWLANYYLGHLPEKETHPAPVLSGACLWVKKEVLDKTGGFDPRFFMYAEDIDLSYRIEQAGYTNYYIADTTVLHFKGESTRKDIRYVKLFYKAMSQFRRKHFSGGLSGVFNALIDAAIWLKAGLTAFTQMFRRNGPAPVSGHYKTWVGGDPVVASRFIARLQVSANEKNNLLRREIVSVREEANEIIFCEGEAYSFKDIIEAIQCPFRQAIYKTHAAGSSSAVGSHSKNRKGETIVL